jgi:hypothetical protein
MTYEQLPDEWKEWIALTPLEQFRRREELFAQYLAMGGSLEPDAAAQPAGVRRIAWAEMRVRHPSLQDSAEQRTMPTVL